MSTPPKDEKPAQPASDLQAWAELLSRHVGTLRRPYATGRPVLVDDEERHDADDARPKNAVDRP